MFSVNSGIKLLEERESTQRLYIPIEIYKTNNIGFDVQKNGAEKLCHDILKTLKYRPISFVCTAICLITINSNQNNVMQYI